MALELHCINSGQGNSIVLRLLDGAFMVVDIDCSGDTPVDPVSYLQKIVPEEYDADEGEYVRRLACAAFTHPHQDHISGLKPLTDAGFVFDEIWEPGHLLSEKEAEDNPAYKEYRKVLQEYEARGKVRKPTAASEKWRADFHGVDVYCLGPSEYLNAVDDDATNREAIHNRCLILRVVTEEMSVLLSGDSAVNQWRERIVPNYDRGLLEADVLVASHHGSRTFFKEDKDDAPYEEAIDLISPEYTLISVSGHNRHGHPHPDALGLYQEYTRGAVAQTKLEGSILVKVAEREKTLERSWVDEQLEKAKVATTRASLALETVPRISLSAKQFKKTTKQPFRPLRNGSSKVPKNEYILFTANMQNRPLGARLKWEVKNWGVDADHRHSQHYEKSEQAGRYDVHMNRTDAEHEWTRHTSYTGRHECIVSLIDSSGNQVLAKERFLVQVGKPLPRYHRKLGR